MNSEYLRQLHWLPIVVALPLIGLALPVAAQHEMPGAVWSSAFFHIDVEGELSSGEEAKPRSGKAFAIGPDHVVTARHVVGSKAEWAGTTKTATNSQRTLRPHELRVYQPVKRSIKLYREEDFGDNHKGNVVLPAVSEDLDAVGILVPGLDAQDYFRLSFCGIEQNEEYRALLSEADDIGNKDSIWSPRLFDLTPTGFRPLEYGSLYVFEVDGVTLPQDGWGHAGSPILDRDGFVVALVSAIVRDSGKLLILATPIQPRTPGATNVLSLDTGFSSERRGHSKCSLSSTVRKIRNQVEEHATWNVKLERDLEGVPKDELTFSYESIAEKANISSIMVEYYFWGKRRGTDPKIQRLTFPGAGENEVDVYPEDPPEERFFRDLSIIKKGKEVLTPFLNEREEGGWIAYLELIIYSNYAKKGTTYRSQKYSVREYQWTSN